MTSSIEIPAPSATMWGRFDDVRWNGHCWRVIAVEPKIVLIDVRGERESVRLPRTQWREITLIRTMRCTMPRGHQGEHARADVYVEAEACGSWFSVG